MDSDMENGIKIHGELPVSPVSQQGATFIAMNLIKALQQDNDATVSASCAYLFNRHPALLEVHVDDHDDALKIKLIEEKAGSDVQPLFEKNKAVMIAVCSNQVNRVSTPV